MQKSEFVRILAKKNNTSIRQATLFLNNTLDALGDVIASGDSILFAGFGSFSIREHDERTAKVPTVEETIHIPPKKAIKFKASKTLVHRLNQ